MSTLSQQLLIIAEGDRDEAALLMRAVRRGRITQGLSELDPTFSPSLLMARTLVGSGQGAFREAHRLMAQQIRTDAQRVAFAGMSDAQREELSAFCDAMYEGNQERFLDRHEGEKAEDFLNRGRKVVLNLTRLVIDVLSQLYRNPPVRTLADNTPEHVSDALKAMWTDRWNLSMLDADRFTRLVGTVALRPFFDPKLPGKIRLWLLKSHQLRVIPDEERPWEAAAVIERHDPFRSRVVMIWTDKSFVKLRRGRIEGEAHGMGRLPHTFLRDRLPHSSFFVQGRGRSLCFHNAHINNVVSDLNEIILMQGFGVPEIIGEPVNKTIALGPRTPMQFRLPAAGAQRPSLNFRSPSAPISELRMNAEAEIKHLLRCQRIPETAIGVDMGARALSGVAIRQSMAPLREDLKERISLFSPEEVDLADSALRVRAEHDDGFAYDHKTEKPELTISYDISQADLDPADQVLIDDFRQALRVETPIDVIMRMDPDRFPDRESAEKFWLANIAEVERGEKAGFVAEPQMAGGGGFGAPPTGSEPFTVPEFDLPDAIAARSGNGNGSA